MRYTTAIVFCLALGAGLFSSCYKKEIQFGSDLPDSYSKIVAIDTVTPILSTFVLDSFPTSGNNILLIGRCKDPVMGTTIARTFFQPSLPDAAKNTTLPDDAVYDSMVLVLNPSKEYYGDTSKKQTFSVYELAAQPDYTYENKLFNTSSVGIHPTPLVTINKSLSPARDSLSFKFPDSKGLAFFNRIRTKSYEFYDETNFLDYFKGLSIQVAAADEGAIYQFKADSSATLRLYYHTTVPYYEKHSIIFVPGRSSYQFNQVLTTRTGTAFQPTYPDQQEFFTSETFPYACSQTGTGVMLKVKFPSLQNILTLGKTVKLLSAELILKPVEGTFDPYGYRLPPSVYMAQTDATNTIGYPLVDATGESTLYSSPFIDDIYRLNTHYSFDLTPYIGYLLNTINTAEDGVFVVEENPGFSKKLNRMVIGSLHQLQYKSKLKLTVLTTTQ